MTYFQDILEEVKQKGFDSVVGLFEEEIIRAALISAGSNNGAARLLKINRTRLVERRRKYGLLNGQHEEI